jgi:hypothetical protein
MKEQHQRTLQALFAHPIAQNLRLAAVEALLVHLGASVERISDHRLRIQLADGDLLMLQGPSGLDHPHLDPDAILRLRRWLQNAGITPEHPTPPRPAPRGEQARRLVIQLDHTAAHLWWLEGESVERAELKPHGLWGAGQRLSHRHDRDIAGQRAPLDHTFLAQISEAVGQADRVLLIGHGHGQSDLRQQLQEHLQRHHPSWLARLDSLATDDRACSEGELLAQARAHFGNAPHRHQLHP